MSTPELLFLCVCLHTLGGAFHQVTDGASTVSAAIIAILLFTINCTLWYMQGVGA